MGKKKVIKKSKEELLKERDQIDEKMKKGVNIKKPKGIRRGRVYISSSYNNTLITLTDAGGNSLAWASAGNIGFKGTKKATPFAASKVASKVCETAKHVGIEEVEVYVKGIGSGRDSAIRSLATHGLEITSIKDITPIPHNGCRPPKPRRV
jgi:small subunit ribosomal protein S11